MNSTHLLQREGGSVVKQGDISSLFSFKLADENRNPITSLNGQEATIRLINVGKISLEITKTVEHDTVSFTIEQVIPVGTYSVEVHVGGYVFPSDNKVWLKIEKSSTDYEVKELVPMDLLALTSKIQSFEQLLAGYRLYDDRELKNSVAQIKTFSEGLASRLDGIKGYDDQALRDEIRGISERIDALVDKDTVYDDTELKEAIADILLRLGKLSNYDDTAIKKEIKELRQELKAIVIPAAYDDQDLKRQIATLDSRLEALEQRADKDTVYNDEVLVQAISEIRQQLAGLSQGNKVEVQAYDDTALKNALAQVNQRLDDLVIPQAYDDSDIKQRLTALEIKPEVDLSAYRLKTDPIELTPEQVQTTGAVVRSEYQSAYMTIDEMKATGFVPTNNVLSPVKFKKPFSKRPMVNILLDIQSNAPRIPYIANVTETGFSAATNYGPDIKGVWYEGWVE